jgi:hypothetical protein
MELLAALQNLPPVQEGLLSAEDRELLKAGTDAIRAARFDPMRRRLVKLVAKHRKDKLPTPALLEQTLDILRAFPLTTESDPAREQRFAGLAYRQLVPEIILSESFTP